MGDGRKTVPAALDDRATELLRKLPNIGKLKPLERGDTARSLFGVLLTILDAKEPS